MHAFYPTQTKHASSLWLFCWNVILYSVYGFILLNLYWVLFALNYHAGFSTEMVNTSHWWADEMSIAESNISQGSSLGPLLLVQYVNNASACAWTHPCCCTQAAPNDFSLSDPGSFGATAPPSSFTFKTLLDQYTEDNYEL